MHAPFAALLALVGIVGASSAGAQPRERQTHHLKAPEHCRGLLHQHPDLVHVTFEINAFPAEAAIADNDATQRNT